MLNDSPTFLQKNLLINLNRRESPNLPGVAMELCVGFLCFAVTQRPCWGASVQLSRLVGTGPAQSPVLLNTVPGKDRTRVPRSLRSCGSILKVGAGGAFGVRGKRGARASLGIHPPWPREAQRCL